MQEPCRYFTTHESLSAVWPKINLSISSSLASSPTTTKKQGLYILHMYIYACMHENAYEVDVSVYTRRLQLDTALPVKDCASLSSSEGFSSIPESSFACTHQVQVGRRSDDRNGHVAGDQQSSQIIDWGERLCTCVLVLSFHVHLAACTTCNGAHAVSNMPYSAYL